MKQIGNNTFFGPESELPSGSTEGTFFAATNVGKLFLYNSGGTPDLIGDKTLINNFNTHTGDTSIHYPMSAITLNVNQISNNYWTSGSTGINSLKTNNDTTTDANGDYSISTGADNIVSGGSSAIIGGYYNNNNGQFSFIGGGAGNTLSTDAITSAIVGGQMNTTNGAASFIGGGAGNTLSIDAPNSAIVGGMLNNNNSQFSFIGGGGGNTLSTGATYSTIVGGMMNNTDGAFSFIGGGQGNILSFDAAYSSMLGGVLNVNNAPVSFIGGGQGNTLSTGATNSSIIGGGMNTISIDTYSSSIVGGNSNINSGNLSSIGGGDSNTISTGGTVSFIGGGYYNNINGQYSFIGGGAGNTLSTDAITSAIVGGQMNTTNGAASFIGGGAGNTLSIDAPNSAIVGGMFNTANAQYSFIGGGGGNTLSTGVTSSFIGGGQMNNISFDTYSSSIVGGNSNINSGNLSVINGGQYNTTSGASSFIGGGSGNTISASATHSSIIGGDSNILSGDNSSIIGGTLNVSSTGATNSSIIGGLTNSVSGASSFIGGGSGNTLSTGVTNSSIIGGSSNVGSTSATNSSIMGGSGNTMSGKQSFIGGGQMNTISTGGDNSLILGGLGNTASGTSSSIVGGINNTNGGTYSSIISSSISNINNGMILSSIIGGFGHSITGGSYSLIGGGTNNTIGNGGLYSFIGGGTNNSINGPSTFIGGGTNNYTFGQNLFVGGGTNNDNRGYNSSILGGIYNSIPGGGSAPNSSIIGGTYNTLSGASSSIVGGSGNTVNAISAIIGGGQGNKISTGATYSSIFGGLTNSVSGSNSSILSSYVSTITNNGTYSLIGAGANNHIDATQSAIIGGIANYINSFSSLSFIGGGDFNIVNGVRSSIIGGSGNNTNTSAQSVIIGGSANNTLGQNLFIGGGFGNSLSGNNSSIIGGQYNTIPSDGSLPNSSIIGGTYNTLSGNSSAIIGGSGNTLTGNRSIILGGQGITGRSDNTVYGVNANFNGNISGNTFVKIGGTSSQFLKADGSVDSNVYLTGTTALTNDFNSHTGDTSIHFPMSAITITESQISNLGSYLPISGGTVNNSLTVLGNLYISGSTTTVDSTNMAIKDNLIYINSGETASGVTLGVAGIDVDRGQLPDYRFVFDESTDNFRVGEFGSTQAVATREDNPIPNGIAYWNDSVNRFDTSNLTINNIVSSSVFNSHTGDTSIHYPMSAITITESQISNLGSYVTNNVFTGHSHTLHQVTNSGNTTTNSISVSGINTSYIQFPSTTATTAVNPREIRWNPDDGTIDLGLNANVTLQVGQENLVYSKALTGITNGEVVYAAGAVGASGRITINKYIANNSISDTRLLGLATEDITNGQFGYVTTFGLVRGIKTDYTGTGTWGTTWSQGDTVYSSHNVYGGLTNIKPPAPNHAIVIGIVVNLHANNGSIFVNPSLRSNLDELHDVTISGLSNNDLLSYNQSTGVWYNKAMSAITITESQISNLGSYALNSNFNSHTGDTSIHYPMSAITLSQIGNSAHTHTVSQITDFPDVYTKTQSENLFVSISGDTMTGGLVTPSVSATTYLGLPTDVRVTGGTYSNGTATFTNNTGGTFNVVGFTTPFTGGTVTGPTNFTNGLTANTMSATTYYGDGSNLSGVLSLTQANTNYVNVTGDTMTGTLILSGNTQALSTINNLGNTTSTLITSPAGEVSFALGKSSGGDSTIVLDGETGRILSNSVSATTITATTFYGNGSNLTGINATWDGTQTITVGENVSAGDLLFLSGNSKYYKANNTSELYSSTELRIAVSAITANNSGSGLIQGRFTTTGLTAGEQYWVGTTSGTYSITQPTANASIVRYIGTALNSTTLEFNPDPTFIELSNVSNITYTGDIRSISTSQTLLTNDYTVVCLSALTLTVPTAVGVAGKIYNIKSRTNATITINTTSGQTIDDDTVISITVKNTNITIQSDGTNWIII